MAKILLSSLLFFLALPSISMAQVKEIQLTVGDTLTLGPCNDTHYKFIDLMVKTRWPNKDLTYNKETGEGFYEWYFNGDIDSGRLPCKYTGIKFRIAHIRNFPTEDGGTRTVVFGQTDDEAVIFWIEMADAYAAAEVLF